MGSGQWNEVPVPSDGYMTIQPSSSFVPEAKARVAECSKQASSFAATCRGHGLSCLLNSPTPQLGKHLSARVCMSNSPLVVDISGWAKHWKGKSCPPSRVPSCPWARLRRLLLGWQQAELKVENASAMGNDGQHVAMQRRRTRMGSGAVEGGVWAAASSPEAHSRARAQARARAAELGPQAAAVGWAGEIGIKTAKKPASSAFSIGPVFHPASRSRARHGENQSTNSLPPPHGASREPLNLPTIASSARHRSSSPRRSPNRDNFSTAAEAFGPTHPPPPSSSSSPIRLLRVLLLGLDQDNTPNNNTLCLSRPCPASIASEPSSPSANPPQSPIQPSTTSTLARRLRSARSKAPHDASTKTRRRPCPIDAQPPFRLHHPA